MNQKGKNKKGKKRWYLGDLAGSLENLSHMNSLSKEQNAIRKTQNNGIGDLAGF